MTKGYDMFKYEVCNFIKIKPKDSITVWTRQNRDFAEQLKNGDVRFTTQDKVNFSIHYAGEGPARLAYKWMVEQMLKRGKISEGHYPIWVCLNRYEAETQVGQRTDEVLVSITLPREKVLVSSHEHWSTVLQAYQILYRKNLEWPDEWLASKPYIPESGIERFNYGLGKVDYKISHTRPIVTSSTFCWPKIKTEQHPKHYKDENECIASWERMFDLNLIKSKSYRSDEFKYSFLCETNITLQGCIGKILPEYIVKTHPK